MIKKIFGPSWRTGVSGVVGGVAIALWPTIQDAINGQLHGANIDIKSLILGAVVALVGYFAKDKAVSNSPAPLAEAQPVAKALPKF